MPVLTAALSEPLDSLEDLELFAGSVDLVNAWLGALWALPGAGEEKQRLYREVLRLASRIFGSRRAAAGLIDRYAEHCTRALTALLHSARLVGPQQLTAASWDVLLQVAVGIAGKALFESSPAVSFGETTEPPLQLGPNSEY